MDTHAWPDGWSTPAELYAATGWPLNDIEDAGCSLAQAGIGIDFDELNQQAQAWCWPLTSVADLLITTRNAFARAGKPTPAL